MSEHEQRPEEEEAEEKDVQDLDVPEEEAEDVKGGLGHRERPQN